MLAIVTMTTLYGNDGSSIFKFNDSNGHNQVRLEEARANFVKSLFFNVPCNFSMTNTMLSTFLVIRTSGIN